jgi:hypothetical protein
MRKAVTVAMSVITFFFLSIGVMGYLAFGNPPCGQGGNILTCFDDPRWLLIATNFMVLIHIFPAYQVGAASVLGVAVWQCGGVRHKPPQQQQGRDQDLAGWAAATAAGAAAAAAAAAVLVGPAPPGRQCGAQLLPATRALHGGLPPPHHPTTLPPQPTPPAGLFAARVLFS